jgi:cell shape-determining protein MreD
MLGHPGDGGRIVLFEGGRLRMLFLLATTAILLAIEGALGRFLPISVDVAALVIVYLALESSLISGAVLALFVGYLGDLVSGESRGLITASLVLVFLLMRLSVVRMTGARWMVITALAVVGTLLALFFRLAIESVIGPGRSSFAAMSPAFLGLVIGAAAFGYPVYSVLRWIDDRFRTREDDGPIHSFLPRRS